MDLSNNLNEHTLELMKNPAKPQRYVNNLPAHQSGPRAKAKGAGKLVLKTLDHLDGRTLAARRAHELVAAISRDLTGDDDQSQLSEGTRQLVQGAAVLGAMIESDQASWLSGDKIDVGSFLAALGMQRRLLCTLGLNRNARDVSPLTLDQIKEQIAARNAADAKELDSVLNPDASIQQRIDAAAQRDEVTEMKRDEAAEHREDAE